MTASKNINVVMVAGEHSGDILGAGLIREFRQLYPESNFSGIGGQRMIDEGFESLVPMQKLSVFGLFEVIKHLPELLSIRKNLKKKILNDRPDIYIGIDAPDFNLPLEKTLFDAGIKTAHYVSPTVWAWRPGRIKKLINRLNGLLCIFPFEEEYFKHTTVPASYVGHPLSKEMAKVEDKVCARQRFGLSTERPVLVMMPGSRLGEIERHSELFLEAAQRCAQYVPELKVLVPFADERTKLCFESILAAKPNNLDIEIHLNHQRSVMQCADFSLVASGTATLELMLLKKPMVVAYVLSPLTQWVFKTFKLLKTPFVSMPNLIAGKSIVPELLMNEATPEALAEQLLSIHYEPNVAQRMINEFNKANAKFDVDADQKAAQVIASIIEQQKC